MLEEIEHVGTGLGNQQFTKILRGLFSGLSVAYGRVLPQYDFERLMQTVQDSHITLTSHFNR